MHILSYKFIEEKKKNTKKKTYWSIQACVCQDVEASAAAGRAELDGQEPSGLPGVRKVDFFFPFRTISSSLGLNVRGTKPSASAASTIHSGPEMKSKIRIKRNRSRQNDWQNFSR